jgi:hypothetical protein
MRRPNLSYSKDPDAAKSASHVWIMYECDSIYGTSTPGLREPQKEMEACYDTIIELVYSGNHLIR